MSSFKNGIYDLSCSNLFPMNDTTVQNQPSCYAFILDVIEHDVQQVHSRQKIFNWEMSSFENGIYDLSCSNLFRMNDTTIHNQPSCYAFILDVIEHDVQQVYLGRIYSIDKRQVLRAENIIRIHPMYLK